MSYSVATMHLHGALETYAQSPQQNDIVETALTIQADYNTVCAVEYLKAHGFAAAVIERVLLQPGQRRVAH